MSYEEYVTGLARCLSFIINKDVETTGLIISITKIEALNVSCMKQLHCTDYSGVGVSKTRLVTTMNWSCATIAGAPLP